MRKILLLIVTLLFLFVGCEDGKETSGGLYALGGLNVRVINLTENSITVIIGPSDYGSIISNDTTDYMPVNVGDNDIHLNSELFLVESFSTSITGNCQQYYTFRFTDGGGYSMNWESELTDWESCMD